MSGLAWRRRLRLALLCTTLAGPLAFAQYVVKTDDDIKGMRPEQIPRAAAPGALPPNPACGLTAMAWQDQFVPGVGYLSPFAIGNSATVNAAGQIAFVSDVYGDEPIQGVFVADSAGVRPIAIGCGSYLGSADAGTCGDPTPAGGTFAGLSQGSLTTPSINDAGDVLFLADVHGGSSLRGLFLFKGATGQIVKVAAIGDLILGDTLSAIGPGSLNNLGEVAFLGTHGPSPSNEDVMILHWRDGAFRKVAAPGDPTPVGGAFQYLTWLGFNSEDGTYIPFLEVPDINDEGAVAFLAYLSGTGTQGGLFVWRDGVHEKYVAYGDHTPAGGAFFNLYAPVLNNEGEIAFQGEYLSDPWGAGWFVGRPGRWREVVSHYDPIDGGQAWGLGVSHNPQQPLDDEGNLLVWVDVKFTETVSVPRVLMGYADGRLETTYKSGDPAPFGGTLGSLQAWPSVHDRRCVIGAGLAGTAGIYSAHMQFLKRPMEVTDLTVEREGVSSVRLSWDGQVAAPDASIAHDVLRGRLSGLIPPAPSECAANDVAGYSLIEPEEGCAAPPGDGCWYLVRAQDSCGAGSYGAGETVCFDACEGSLIPGCPVCGDGAINGTEQCDGAALNGHTCQSRNYDGGTLACTASCALDTTGCTFICGNGIIRGDEECDGSNLRGYRCAHLGFDAGMLGCTTGCAFDFSGCCCTDGTPGCPACPVCGNGVREAPYELCDGQDLGGETCWSQGHLPAGELLCSSSCDGFIAIFCTVY